MKRLVIALVASIGLLGLLQQWRSNSLGQSNKHLRDLLRTDEIANPENESTERIRTKPRNRPLLEKPSIEETTELLKTTIIPLVDLPADQSVPERISQINDLIHAVGVEPSRLRLILRSGDPAARWKSDYELRIRDFPVNAVLKYVCGNTKLRYHVRENGIVELTTTFDPEPMPDPPARESAAPGNDHPATEADDPFAEPPQSLHCSEPSEFLLTFAIHYP